MGTEYRSYGESLISTIKKAAAVCYAVTWGIEQYAIDNFCAGVKEAFGEGVNQMIKEK